MACITDALSKSVRRSFIWLMERVNTSWSSRGWLSDWHAFCVGLWN